VLSVSEDVWRTDVKAVAEDGRVLLEDKVTWRELEDMGFWITISDPASPPVAYTSTPPPQPTVLAHSTPPPAACWGRGQQSSSAPSPPTNLRAELVSSALALEGQTVRLQWDDNADDEQCYVIEKKAGEEGWSIYEAVGDAASSGAGAVSTEVVPLEPGVHCYRVYFGNEEGRSAYSNEACLNVEVPPRIHADAGAFYTWPAPAPPTPAPAPASPRRSCRRLACRRNCNAGGPAVRPTRLMRPRTSYLALVARGRSVTSAPRSSSSVGTTTRTTRIASS
jgi:hypothetical protein